MTNEKTPRKNYSSGIPWEPLRGYSRAVRVGNSLYVSGMTAVTEKGEVVAPGDAYQQTKYILENVRFVLKKAGFQMTDVVRTRLMVTDLSKWKNYAHAHRQVFDAIRPASSICEVARLMDPRMMIEIEVEAILNCGEVETVQIHLDESPHEQA
jgi:enamine deaminase RidA (YjgF/YER057c/UK114 family)